MMFSGDWMNCHISGVLKMRSKNSAVKKAMQTASMTTHGFRPSNGAASGPENVGRVSMTNAVLESPMRSMMKTAKA